MNAASATLLDDLSLVLSPRPRTAVEGAWIKGQAVSVEQAIERAAALLTASSAPAIAGLKHLSIEACREAIALAEAMRGRLLADHAAPQRAPITMTATLGHARAAQRVLWVGLQPHDAPPRLNALLREAQHEILPGTLAAVWNLRTQIAGERVAALLAADLDPRVAGQWHKLAADVQRQARLAVLHLPWPGDAENSRGADEVVTWQTGLSLLAGGVDFADGAPRPCPAFDTLQRGIDLLLSAGHHGFSPRITLGRRDDDAEVCFGLPGLVPGLAAQVARFDGVILWLCDDPAAAPPDPAVAVLQRLRCAVRSRP